MYEALKSHNYEEHLSLGTIRQKFMRKVKDNSEGEGECTNMTGFRGETLNARRTEIWSMNCKCTV